MVRPNALRLVATLVANLTSPTRSVFLPAIWRHQFFLGVQIVTSEVPLITVIRLCGMLAIPLLRELAPRRPLAALLTLLRGKQIHLKRSSHRPHPALGNLPLSGQVNTCDGLGWHPCLNVQCDDRALCSGVVVSAIATRDRHEPWRIPGQNKHRCFMGPP